MSHRVSARGGIIKHQTSFPRGEASSADANEADRSVNGRLSIDKAAMTTRTALSLPPGLPLSDWINVGEQVFVIADASTWWLGDWLVFGEKAYPDRYRRAITETRLDYGTLRNYAWVARKFDVSRRRDRLSFHHHYEVAGLPEDEQDVWLDRAEKDGWSKSKLRRELRVSRRGAKEVEPANTDAALRDLVRLQVTATPEQCKRWQEAAERSECELVAWMTDVLDGTARSVLRSDETAVEP